ncbi:hypothetical protein HRbin27_00873 [bacterium HR27]|nr:hypothetical protein HRbin27_00873 [bacterium HR27]
MRPAHLTRDGRIVCSVPGCGFLIGVLTDVPRADGWSDRMLASNAHLLYDPDRGVWHVGRRYHRYGATYRRDPKEFRQAKVTSWRKDGRPPIEPELRPEEDVVYGGIPLPATVLCPNGHQSILDPDKLGVTAWIGHDKKVHRRP